MPVSKHLFILTGQSNMQRLKPAQSFTPSVAAALGAENIIVVKEAWGGQAIRRWCKSWRSSGVVNSQAKGMRQPAGDLYDRLMHKVSEQVEGHLIGSVTLIFMQGEEDACEHLAAAYRENLESLLQQFRSGLQQYLQLPSPQQLKIIIGQINNFGHGSHIDHYWCQVQDAQAAVAENCDSCLLVATDDVEVSDDGLHFSDAGFLHLGQKFAGAALSLQR